MPKAKLNGVFDSYNSSKDVSAIPINIMTKGAFNCYVHNGEIRSREKFQVEASADTTERTIKLVNNYESNDNFNRIIEQRENITSGVNTIYTAAGLGTSRTALSPTIGTNRFPFKRAYANGVMYLSYGVATPYKYIRDSSTDYFEPQGLPKPTTPSAGSFSTSGGSGGFEAGITDYVVSFVYKVGSIHEVEGEISDVKSYTTTTSGTGRVVNMVVTQPLNNDAQSHITHFNVYRRHPSQDTYYFVEQVAFTGVGSTQNYTDDDGAVFDLTSPAYETNDFGNQVETNIQLTDPHYGIEWHQGRMWYASTDGETLHYSEAGLPESVRLSLTIGWGGDPFTELISLGDSMLIVKRLSVWLLTGDDITNFEVNQVASFGSIVPNMTFYYNGYLYGMDISGIWRWNLSGPREVITNQIQRDWESGTLSLNSGSLEESIFTPIGEARLPRFSYAIDKHTDHIWFDIAMDESEFSFLGVLVYDPTMNKFKGIHTFGHSALGNVTDVYDYECIYSNIITQYSPIGYKESGYSKFDVENLDGAEDDFPIRIQLGMLPNLDASVGEYLWRYLKWYFAEFPDENWSLKVLVDGSEVTIDNSINFGTTNKHEIGRSGEELSLIFESTASEGGVRLTKLELDYEETNQW